MSGGGQAASSFWCEDAECLTSVECFTTEAARDAHTQAAHAAVNVFKTLQQTPPAGRRTHTEVELTLIHKTGRLQTHTMETSDSTPGRLVVADGVTKIDDKAYRGRKDLIEVWLPDSV